MDYLQKKIQDYFDLEAKNSKEILNCLALIVYSQRDDDTYVMAKLLPDDFLKAVIAYFDGRAPKLPTNEEFENDVLVAIAYFLHEIQGLSWPEIRKKLSIDGEEIFSPVAMGKRVSKLKEKLTLRKSLLDILEKVDIKDIEKIIKK